MKLFQLPKKSLGQNFLVDKNIIDKIVKIPNLIKNKTIVEIGAGYGALTNAIIKFKPKKIFAIEKDKKLSSFLSDEFKKDKNVNVINDDIFNFIQKKNIEKNIIVYGNLPYNISTQILARLILLKKWPPWYEELVFMFQKEVADRILAKLGDKEYGRLSILSNWRLDIKKHFDISKNSFIPKPNINSTILSFKPKKNNLYKLKDPKSLELVTRTLFSKRRKMINKNFKKLFKESLGISNKLNLNLKLRPEEINNETYYKIAQAYED